MTWSKLFRILGLLAMGLFLLVVNLVMQVAAVLFVALIIGLPYAIYRLLNGGSSGLETTTKTF